MLASVFGNKVPTEGRDKPPAKYVTTNDGVKIAWDVRGASGPPLMLIHGWSGSRHYFDRNVEGLSKHFMVYTIDLRFHGDSDKPDHGFHVARLAADLHNVLQSLSLEGVTLLGTSMGCAVIWSYIELFGEARIAKCVFVDQAPLQYNTPDWKLGSKGCYDPMRLAALQAVLECDFEGFARGNADCCLSKPLPKEMIASLGAETLRCSPSALGALMADHTQLDWRPLLRRITVPCLNLVGRKSGVFPWEGCAEVGQLVANCQTMFFEDCNHWLYLEEPAKFNKVVASFAG